MAGFGHERLSQTTVQTGFVMNANQCDKVCAIYTERKCTNDDPVVFVIPTDVPITSHTVYDLRVLCNKSLTCWLINGHLVHTQIRDHQQKYQVAVPCVSIQTLVDGATNSMFVLYTSETFDSHSDI